VRYRTKAGKSVEEFLGMKKEKEPVKLLLLACR
jgi:hypothetical protein